jgi:hypothetical protein
MHHACAQAYTQWQCRTLQWHCNGNTSQDNHRTRAASGTSFTGSCVAGQGMSTEQAVEDVFWGCQIPLLEESAVLMQVVNILSASHLEDGLVAATNYMSTGSAPLPPSGPVQMPVRPLQLQYRSQHFIKISKSHPVCLHAPHDLVSGHHDGLPPPPRSRPRPTHY